MGVAYISITLSKSSTVDAVIREVLTQMGKQVTTHVLGKFGLSLSIHALLPFWMLFVIEGGEQPEVMSCFVPLCSTEFACDGDNVKICHENKKIGKIYTMRQNDMRTV